MVNRTFSAPLRRPGRRAYYVRVYDRGTGLRTWISTRCSNLAAAREWVKTCAIEEAMGPERVRAQNVAVLTFADALDGWLRDKQACVSKGYAEILRLIAERFWRPRWGRRRLTEIDTGAVRSYLTDRRGGALNGRQAAPRRLKHAGVAAATLNNDRRNLATFFNWCIRQGWLVVNPVHGTDRYTGEPRRRTRYLSHEEEERLLYACSAPTEVVVLARRNRGGQDGGKVTRERSQFTQTVTPPRWLRPMVVVALRSGLRRRTILQLTWADLDVASRMWQIPATKMKSGREYSAPVAESVVKDLLAHRAAVEERCRRRGESAVAALAPDSSMFPLSLHTRLTRPFQAACRRAGLQLTFHDLRRCFLNRLRENGVSLEAAMALSDHASLQVVLQHYRQVPEKELRSSVMTLDKKCRH